MKERDEKKTCLLHDIKTLYNYIVGKLNVWALYTWGCIRFPSACAAGQWGLYGIYHTRTNRICPSFYLPANPRAVQTVFDAPWPFITIIDTLLGKIDRSKMTKWQETEQIWHQQKSGQEGERPQHFSVLLLFTISLCVSWNSNDHHHRHHHFLFRFQALICANTLFIIRDCLVVQFTHAGAINLKGLLAF